MDEIFTVAVGELLKEVGSCQRISFEARPYFDDEQFDLSDDLKVDLELTNTGESLLVTGGVSGQLILKCSRCLKNFEYPLAVRIEEQFSPKPRKSLENLEKELELGEDDFIFPVSPDQTIDLKELIRQNILMSLPMKPLCSPNCPRVEKNLSFRLDPRFKGLEKLKNKLNEEKK